MSGPYPVNSVADFWTAQGKAFLMAQQQAAKAFANGMQAFSSGTLGALVKTSPLAVGNPTIEPAFRKMLDPRGWLGGLGEVDDVLGRKAEGPRFADLWEIERRYARVLQAWMTSRRTGLGRRRFAILFRK